MITLGTTGNPNQSTRAPSRVFWLGGGSAHEVIGITSQALSQMLGLRRASLPASDCYSNKTFPGRFASIEGKRHSGAVTSFISHTSVDCHNAYQLSEWWKQVLGYVDIHDDPNEPGDDHCMIRRPDGGHHLLFIEVPESKEFKNRIHLDLRPTEGTRDHELSRLLELGATQISDFRGFHGPGTGWVILADPEGNEFCILRSLGEAGLAHS